MLISKALVKGSLYVGIKSYLVTRNMASCFEAYFKIFPVWVVWREI